MKYIVRNNITLISSPEEIPEDFYKVSVYEPSGIKDGHGPSFLSRWSKAASCTISGREWLDFVDPSVNKGAALTSLMEYVNVSPKECAAFGDNYNDLEMLCCVAYGYVMNQAAPDIKSRFSYHCEDVLPAIEELLGRTI